MPPTPELSPPDLSLLLEEPFVSTLLLSGLFVSRPSLSRLVSAFADRLDPKVRDCIARSMQAAGPPVTHDYAVAMCKRLEAMGGL